MDSRLPLPAPSAGVAVHVFRWDLDKTYIETEISSVRAMIRQAFEPASHKRNVPGSAALLRSLTRHDPASRVAIVSGSPRQMRRVLEEKLALDGVRFDRLVLKDNLGNLRKGRLRALYEQMGYKLPVLFQERTLVAPTATETCFGDDAEIDALIYTTYAEAVAGRLTERDVQEVLEAAGAYPDAVELALAALSNVPSAPDPVEHIFIRLIEGTPVGRFAPLGRRVVPVHSWLQAALVLWHAGRLDAEDVAAVARAVVEATPLTDEGLAGQVQDIVRRGHLPHAAAVRWIDETDSVAPLREPLRRALAHLAAPPPPAEGPIEADPMGFLRLHRRSSRRTR